jgi:hypothetical protein
VALLHQDRPTVSDGDHLCGEASSQEKRRPHQEAAGKKSHGDEHTPTLKTSANTARGDGGKNRLHKPQVNTWMRRPHHG